MVEHPTYRKDNAFKAKARLHQSEYRKKVLGLEDFDVYGNRLTENAGAKLLNYFDGLGVRTLLRGKYPNYSKLRDGDMLRSEHIPFNLFAPFVNRHSLGIEAIKVAFGISLELINMIEIEWPDSKSNLLGDHTAFDTYIEGVNAQNKILGIGIEVKYTEGAYRIGESEKVRIDNPDSSYWNVTKNSGYFLEQYYSKLPEDTYRQIWRNQILGIAMMDAGQIDDFYSITIFPAGNGHFIKAIPQYVKMLAPDYRDKLIGCTFEKFIDSIPHVPEFEEWIKYLKQRYIISTPI